MNSKLLLAIYGFSILLTLSAAEPKVVLPESVPDRFERFNRTVWGVNQGIMTVLVKPTGKVYRVIVRKPVRIMIKNFGRNITYPGRLFNNLLQARWTGARDETYRFGCNTVLGTAGFFD